MNRFRLSELKKGTSATIVTVDNTELRVALMNLGVLEGDSCRLSDVAPLGDPIAILVNGAKISLRMQEASAIWVR